jgi:hypothetical protein
MVKPNTPLYQARKFARLLMSRMVIADGWPGQYYRKIMRAGQNCMVVMVIPLLLVNAESNRSNKLKR